MFLDKVSTDQIWNSRVSFKNFLYTNTNMITSLSRFISSPSFSKGLSNAENPTGLKIADIGCGVGWAGDLFSSIHPVSIVYYIDLPSAPTYPNFNSSLFTDICKSTAREYRSGAFGSLPFPSCSIDILIYNASIHHTSDLISLFLEAFRVLSTNGLILITNEHLIPESQFLFLYLKKMLRQFLRYYSFEAYPQAISAAYIYSMMESLMTDTSDCDMLLIS